MAENGFAEGYAVGRDTNGNGYGYPVMPVYGMGNNNGFGGFGSDWLAIIVLFALFGGGFGGGFGGFGGGYDFPWLLNGQQQVSNNTNNGFRDAQLHDSITSVRDGVSNLATQLCGCCGDMQMSLANGFSNIAQQMSANEIASLNRSFAEQTANTAGFTNVNSNLCDLRYAIATEGANTRAESTRNTQLVLDKLCQLELDGVKGQLAQAQRENVGLQNQLNMADFRASQIAQTAQLREGQNAEVDALYNRLMNCPVPTTPVYGRTPIFTCPNNNNGCGCGCGNNNF